VRRSNYRSQNTAQNMKNAKLLILLTIIPCGINYSAWSQKKAKVGDEIFATPNEPRPENTIDILLWISKSLHFPEAFRNLDCSGKLVVEFTVNKYGKVLDVDIFGLTCKDVQGFNKLRKSFQKTAASCPRWKPALKSKTKIFKYRISLESPIE
jgi:hypothetical protein